MWAQRELLLFLVWRDITVRYKQTVLGVAWAVVQPLLMTSIFTMVFGRFVEIDTSPFPYPVFAFAGMMPWPPFSQGMTASATSLVDQQHLPTSRPMRPGDEGPPRAPRPARGPRIPRLDEEKPSGIAMERSKLLLPILDSFSRRTWAYRRRRLHGLCLEIADRVNANPGPAAATTRTPKGA